MAAGKLRFLLGRSGSGKTHYCIESLRQQLIDSPVGPNLILLVPEQATFQMEQALLIDDQLKGYNRARVTSFGRLAQQILLETAPPTLPILTENGKRMILRRLLQQRIDELRIFNRAALKSGFIARLSKMLSELRQYSQSPETLREQLARLSSASDASLEPLRNKLADLTLIYEDYRGWVRGRFVEPEDFLDLMVEQCSRCEFLKGSHLWIDGFAGFTPQQFRALFALAASVSETEFSLCLNPTAPACYAIDADPQSLTNLSDMDLFHPTLETYQKLRRTAGALGVSIAQPLLFPLNKQKTMPRFDDCEILARLESNLAENRIEPAQSLTADVDIAPQGVAIVKAPDRRVEVETVARQILRLCRQYNYRFRDIAVILRDFSEYEELLRSSFADHGIACFVDQRRSVRHHPLIELLRSALSVLTSEFQTEYLLDYLKTDLANLSRQAVDELENYALAHAFTGRAWLQTWQSALGEDQPAPEEDTVQPLTAAQLDNYRTQAVEPLLKMRDEIYNGPPEPNRPIPVRQITAALVNLLERLEVPRTLSQWCTQAGRLGQLDAVLTHQQVYSDLLDIFDDLAQTLIDQQLTLEEYSEILSSVLGEMTLALIPPALDQVLVGTIERSRHPRIRAAFILGVNEGSFPKVSSPDSFLTDSQRESLLDEGFELGPTSVRKLLNERYLAYIAVTRPREFVWISYPAARADGTALKPSSMIDHIYDAAGDVPTIHLGGDIGQADMRRITSTAQLGRELALEFSRVHPGQQPEPLWRELAAAALNHADYRETIKRSLSGLTYNNQAVLTPEIVQRMYRHELTGSVSRLETFAACPFKHFASYALNLRERAELSLAAPDMGAFYHEALKDIFLTLKKQNRGWADLDNDELDQIVAQTTDSLARNHTQIAELLNLSARSKTLINFAAEHLKRFCRVLCKHAGASDFVQRSAEIAFGPETHAGALEYDLPDGGKILLRGRIDRVDYCDERGGIMVIDYKSSGGTFPFGHFYYGLSLQLLTYLLVLEKYSRDANKPVSPVGAVYLPITRSGDRRSGMVPEGFKQDYCEPETDVPIHKARGIIDGVWIEHLDKELIPAKYSSYFGAYMNKEGEVFNGKSSDIVCTEDLENMLRWTSLQLIEQGRRILAGEISVRPYRYDDKESPCEYCQFRPLCRFDVRVDRYRTLRGFSKEKENVLSLIAAQLEGADNE